MIDYEALLTPLIAGGVEFIVIGGVAAIIQGSPLSTQDVDVVYRRSEENMRRLCIALEPFRPYLRGAPPGLPFRFDPPTVERGLNFTLQTSLGPLDVLGEIVGGGGYDDLLPHSFEIESSGRRMRVLGLRRLIEVKRAAGRPKDLEAIAQLEVLLEERDAMPGGGGVDAS